MKVKEYLVHRLVEVERDLETSCKNYAALMKEVKALTDKCDKLEYELDHYQMEREHIKQIITCNISLGDSYEPDKIDLNAGDNDFKTLMAILDINPGDYKEVTEDAETKD